MYYVQRLRATPESTPPTRPRSMHISDDFSDTSNTTTADSGRVFHSDAGELVRKSTGHERFYGHGLRNRRPRGSNLVRESMFGGGPIPPGQSAPMDVGDELLNKVIGPCVDNNNDINRYQGF